MKEFDNFKSWVEEETKVINKIKKIPDYANYLSYRDKKGVKHELTYKLSMSFYYKYFSFGSNFLRNQICALKDYPRKESLLQLLEACIITNEEFIKKYEEMYFPVIGNSDTQNNIINYMPVCKESISHYINGPHSNISTFIDSVSAMLIIGCYESDRYTYRCAEDIVSFLFGDIFIDLFNEIRVHPNPSIRTALPKIKTRLGYYYRKIFDENIYENNLLLENINKALHDNFENSTVSWKNVLFQNGYFLIFHPDHPKGEGKYKPFRMDCAKSVKAFNHVKEYILRKLPPIEVEYKDDIIVSVKPSCFDSIDNAITTLSKHTSAPIIKIEGQKESQFAHLRKGDYTNREAKEALRQLKSQYLDYLSSIHIDTDKLYYCIEKRINSNAVVVEEDAFFFSIQSNPIYTLLAFENTLPSRATILFTCKNNELNKAIDFIHDYFSSPEINKREKFLVKKLNLTDYGIVKYERVLHDSYSSWLTHVEGIRKNFQF